MVQVHSKDNGTPRKGGRSAFFFMSLVVIVLPVLYFNDGMRSLQLQQGSSLNKKHRPSKNQLLVSEKCQAITKRQNKWSNKPHKESKVHSLFNCDLPDSLCSYFYPANFFDRRCGLGKAFAQDVDVAHAKHRDGSLWQFQQAIGFPTLTIDNLCFLPNSTSTSTGGSMIQPTQRNKHKANMGRSSKANSESTKTLTQIGESYRKTDNHRKQPPQQRCITERLSFLHVHKSGGSTLHEAFNTLASDHDDTTTAITRHKHFKPAERPGVPYNPQDRTNSPEMKRFALESLQDATRYPAKHSLSPTQHVIFAVVRDPTERFISSIGQVLGGPGSSRNQIGKVLIDACVTPGGEEEVKVTSQSALKCIAKYVWQHGYWIELHFTPQVIDIGFTTLWQDVPIAIFPMKPGLSQILTYLNIPSDLKVRDGASDNYRKHDVLKKMTVDDYDEESLEWVCSIYEMDVRMQRSLGMQVPRCDPYIPKDDYDFQL